jgi:hypothetical protein
VIPAAQFLSDHRELRLDTGSSQPKMKYFDRYKCVFPLDGRQSSANL